MVRLEPVAELGLVAFLLAGLITVVPLFLQDKAEPVLRLKALQAAKDRDFLLVLGATFSVILALFLFSSADRIVAQSWFGTSTYERLPFNQCRRAPRPAKTIASS